MVPVVVAVEADTTQVAVVDMVVVVVSMVVAVVNTVVVRPLEGVVVEEAWHLPPEGVVVAAVAAQL